MRAVLLFLTAFSILSARAQVVSNHYYDSLLLALNRMDEIRATHMVKRHFFLWGIRRKGIKVSHVAKGRMIEHPVGVWQWYWPNGQLKEHVNFNIQGFPQGISNRYYPDGQLMCRVIYDPPAEATYNEARYSFYWDDYDRYEMWFNTDGSFYYEGKFSGSTKTGMHIEVDDSEKFHRYYYISDILQVSIVVIPGREFFNVNARRTDFPVVKDSSEIFRIPPRDLSINPMEEYAIHCVHYKQKHVPGTDITNDSESSEQSFAGMADDYFREGRLAKRKVFGADSVLKGTWYFSYSSTGDTTEATWDDVAGKHRTVVFDNDSGKIQKKIFDPSSKLVGTVFYRLDEAGRLLAMERDQYGYRYHYDSRGFLTQSTITSRDEAWHEDVVYHNDAYGFVRYSYAKGSGKIRARTRYFYDVYGRLCKVIRASEEDVSVDRYYYSTPDEERN